METRTRLLFSGSFLLLTLVACDSSTLTNTLAVTDADSENLNIEDTQELTDNGNANSNGDFQLPVTQSENPVSPNEVTITAQEENETVIGGDTPDVGNTPDAIETANSGQSDVERACLNHPAFTNTGVYTGTMTRNTNSTSHCEYDVTLTFDEPSYVHDEHGVCIQLAEITAIGTQLISGQFDCYSIQSEELSIYWGMQQQFVEIPATRMFALRENFVYPLVADTNNLTMHNIITVPDTNESGLRYEPPPGLTRLYMLESLDFTSPFYEGVLKKVN